MNKKYIILSSIVVIALTFYWFQWRPAEIRKNCVASVYNPQSSNFGYNQFVENGKEFLSNDQLYQKCLRKHGIEK